jgi:hypothetical protein
MVGGTIATIAALTNTSLTAEWWAPLEEYLTDADLAGYSVHRLARLSLSPYTLAFRTAEQR